MKKKVTPQKNGVSTMDINSIKRTVIGKIDPLLKIGTMYFDNSTGIWWVLIRKLSKEEHTYGKWKMESKKSRK